MVWVVVHAHLVVAVHAKLAVSVECTQSAGSKVHAESVGLALRAPLMGSVVRAQPLGHR